MEALSSLITKRRRADKNNNGDSFDLLFHYIKKLELKEPRKQMKIIHVAGTKGKVSTCTFTESILRSCGFSNGLFISPHLIRERFWLDGLDISEEKFLEYFWCCWDRLKERTSVEVPMPTFFCFLALHAFKIFAAEQVDVVILEVGLGGKFDAANVVCIRCSSERRLAIYHGKEIHLDKLLGKRQEFSRVLFQPLPYHNLKKQACYQTEGIRAGCKSSSGCAFGS